jgi:hypothetical protein
VSVQWLSRPVDKTTGLRNDQTIVLGGPKTAKLYPTPLGCVTYVDPETPHRFVFLTNNFMLAPLQMPHFYRCGWPIELCFKWIAQHLRFKAYYATSESAVKTKIWSPIGIYGRLESSKWRSSSRGASMKSSKP